MMPTPLRIQDSGRTLAFARVMLAIVLLNFAVTENGNPQFRHESDDLAAGLYLLAALTFAGIAARSWWWDYRLFWYATAIDFLAFLIIPINIVPNSFGFFPGATAIAVLILLRCLLFMDRRVVAATCFVLNLSYYILCMAPPMGPALVDTDIWADLRHLLSMTFVTVLLVGLAGRLQALPRLPAFNRARARGTRELAELAGAYYAGLFSAARWTFCWQPEGDPDGLVTASWDGTTDDRLGRTVPCCQPTEAQAAWPVIFDEDGARGLAIDERGAFRYLAHVPRADTLIARSGYASGISLPVNGQSGNGRLILTDITHFHLDVLRHAASVPSAMASAFDSFAWLEARQEAALIELRGMLARDLHDSVAQSLAGASFWLKATASRDDVSSDARGDILRAADALDKENAEIRQVILALRQRGPGERMRCSDTLRDTIARCAQMWDVDVSFSTDAEEARADSAFLTELNQIAREAISNAVRHGHARRIGVSLARSGPGFDFSIRDDGIGFASNTSPRSLEERVSRLGGTLSTRSDGSGSIVTMTFGGANFQ